jgi:hypothetical protein
VFCFSLLCCPSSPSQVAVVPVLRFLGWDFVGVCCVVSSMFSFPFAMFLYAFGLVIYIYVFGLGFVFLFRLLVSFLQLLHGFVSCFLVLLWYYVCVLLFLFHVDFGGGWWL